MAKKEKSTYPPHLRDYFQQKPTVIKGYSQKDYIKIPDPVRDPIVSNNIADREFDYTYNEDDDIGFDKDYYDED